MSRRVVVTGMGAITPIGLSVEEFWQSVKEGKIGFGEITKFDTEGYKCHLAAEVKDFDYYNWYINIINFNLREPYKSIKRYK